MLCLDLHAYLFFLMFLLRSTSLCLDLCVCVLCAMFVCLDLYVGMPCAYIALWFLDVFLSCVLALIGGV